MSESEKRHRVSSDAPSNTELAQRMARVEEGVDHVETKLDHQAELLDRIADNLDDELDDQSDTIESIKPQHNRLWFTYQAIQWLSALLLGGAVTTLGLKIALGIV